MEVISFLFPYAVDDYIIIYENDCFQQSFVFNNVRIDSIMRKMKPWSQFESQVTVVGFLMCSWSE